MIIVLAQNVHQILQQLGDNLHGHAHQTVGRLRRLTGGGGGLGLGRAIVGATILVDLQLVILAKATGFHHKRIAAIARPAGGRAEHVEIVARVVAIQKAIGTQGHAQRNGTGSTSIGDKVACPHEATFEGGVVLFDYVRVGRGKRSETSSLNVETKLTFF